MERKRASQVEEPRGAWGGEGFSPALGSLMVWVGQKGGDQHEVPKAQMPLDLTDHRWVTT